MTKNIAISAVVVAAVLGALAFFGLSPFGKAIVKETFGNSSSGATFNSAKYAGVVANLSAPGANATSSSVINGDASDRYVTGIRFACQGVGTSKTAYTGAGLAALTVAIATTSTSGPVILGNTNTIGAATITIGTSTPQFAFASSTINSFATTSAGSIQNSGGVTSPNFIWASGTYMTFLTNATNTAICTFGVDYIGA